MDSHLKWRHRRSAPYYKRSQGHNCRLYTTGGCPRGADCPHAVESPYAGGFLKHAELYYQANNPEVLKLLWTRGPERPPLEPPDDKSIRTLYVSNMDGRITELDLRDRFSAYGEIETLKMVSEACAFITYMTRESAEKAAKELSNKLIIKGLWMKLMWDKPQPAESDSIASDEASPASSR